MITLRELDERTNNMLCMYTYYGNAGFKYEDFIEKMTEEFNRVYGIESKEDHWAHSFGGFWTLHSKLLRIGVDCKKCGTACRICEWR